MLFRSEALRRLPIPLPKGASTGTSYIPLGEIATLDVSPGPNQVSRENGKRRIVISANVRGRDVGGFGAAQGDAMVDVGYRHLFIVRRLS